MLNSKALAGRNEKASAGKVIQLRAGAGGGFGANKTDGIDLTAREAFDLGVDALLGDAEVMLPEL